MPGPTRADLEAARGRGVADVLGPGLRVLFCGINPGLYSAAVGHHFARPGNRFWRALAARGVHRPRAGRPSEDADLPSIGIGITNLVAGRPRPAAELDAAELRAGAAERLAEFGAPVRSRWPSPSWASAPTAPPSTIGGRSAGAQHDRARRSRCCGSFRTRAGSTRTPRCPSCRRRSPSSEARGRDALGSGHGRTDTGCAAGDPDSFADLDEETLSLLAGADDRVRGAEGTGARRDGAARRRRVRRRVRRGQVDLPAAACR